MYENSYNNIHNNIPMGDILDATLKTDILD